MNEPSEQTSGPLQRIDSLQHESACDATPHHKLIRELMDSRVPKNEREWAAAREIENLCGMIEALPDLLDALLQWKASDRDNDPGEMMNARRSRDAAIAKALGMQANT